MAQSLYSPGGRALLRGLWLDYFRRYILWVLLAMLLMAIEGSMLGVMSYTHLTRIPEIFGVRLCGNYL